MLATLNESLAAFTKELEFRAGLFRKPLDAHALNKLHPEPCEVFRSARLSGADSEIIKEYISALAARQVQVTDDAGEHSVMCLTQDAILLLADVHWAEWSDCWQVRS